MKYVLLGKPGVLAVTRGIICLHFFRRVEFVGFTRLENPGVNGICGSAIKSEKHDTSGDFRSHSLYSGERVINIFVVVKCENFFFDNRKSAACVVNIFGAVPSPISFILFIDRLCSCIAVGKAK